MVIEYGVRRYGGHVEPHISLHVARAARDRLLAAGEKNVWIVKRRVGEWERANSLDSAPTHL